MTDQLPEGWITLERAYQFLREGAAVDGSDFIQRRWDCKYINARIDMRTGKVLLTPGNSRPAKDQVSEAAEIANSFIQYAYQHGMHEVGFDPVKVLTDEIARLETHNASETTGEGAK